MSAPIIHAIIEATWETLYMVFLASFIAFLIGIPLGIALLTTRPKHLLENRSVQFFLSTIVNITRSVPFLILLIAIIPLTRFIVGTSIGTTAAIVPLTIGAIPFVARLVENALTEVPSGLIQAGLAMGAQPRDIIIKILLPESLSGIINAMTVTIITLIGYSAMAGTVGGGGLGDLAYRYGYQRFDTTVMIITVVLLVFIVQCIQMLGDCLVRHFSHRS